jgi:uncharacterized membrane protein YbhN (UPF0104 family)
MGMGDAHDEHKKKEENTTLLPFSENKKNMRRWIKTGLYLLTIVSIMIYLFYHAKDFQNLSRPSILEWIILIGTTLMALILNGMVFKIAMEILGIKMSWQEWFGISSSNAMYNYVLPAKGGVALVAYYLKQRHQLDYSKYLGLFGGITLLGMVISAGVAVIFGSLMLYMGEDRALIYTFISSLIFVGTLLGLFLLWRLDPEKFSKKNRFLRLISSALKSLKSILYQPRKVLKFTILLLLLLLISSWRLYIAFEVIALSVPLEKLIFINALVTYSMFFTLIPGNLGIKEGIIGITSGLLGITFDSAIMAALIDRAVHLGVTFLVGFFFSHFLIRNM